MSTVIQDPQGNDVEVYVEGDAGRIVFSVRATDEATLIAAGKAQGVFDAEGNPAPGVGYTPLGRHPLTFDADGTPLTFDDRFHADFVLSPPASTNETAGYLNWKATALAWAAGADDPNQNSAESAKVVAGVSLIDRATMAKPRHIYL